MTYRLSVDILDRPDDTVRTAWATGAVSRLLFESLVDAGALHLRPTEANVFNDDDVGTPRRECFGIRRNDQSSSNHLNRSCKFWLRRANAYIDLRMDKVLEASQRTIQALQYQIASHHLRIQKADSAYRRTGTRAAGRGG